jgi:hypothetical protein
MRKESIILILAFASGVEQSLGPMVTPGLGIVADKYGVSADLVASLLIEFFSFWIGVPSSLRRVLPSGASAHSSSSPSLFFWRQTYGATLQLRLSHSQWCVFSKEWRLRRSKHL